MKLFKILFMSLLLGAPLASQAAKNNDFDDDQDVINEMFVGQRRGHSDICQVGHRKASYGYPEIFISFHTKNDDEFVHADSGLLEAFGVEYNTYQKLLYSTVPVDLVVDKVAYRYSIEGRSFGNKRIVTLKGITITDENRRSDGEIELINDQIETVTIRKYSRTLLNHWSKTFEDSCSSFKKLGL